MIEFFKNELNCSNVPKQVIDFYNKYDGKRLIINEIFSKEEIKQEINGYFKEFLNSGIKHNENDMLIPIADDGMGGYYAFIGNKQDENIYYFDHEFPLDDSEIYTIEDILNMDKELNKN